MAPTICWSCSGVSIEEESGRKKLRQMTGLILDRKLSVARGDMNALEGAAFEGGVEEFFSDFGEELVGDDGINEAGAPFEFRAALSNESGQGIVMRERDAVVLADALFDLLEVESDDELEHFLTDREERNDD